jgi:hypothetical protein
MMDAGMMGERNTRGRFEARRSSVRAHLRLIASKSRTGRIKLAVRREFILSNGHPITIRQVLQRGYPRLRRFTSWHYLAARRALRSTAVVIARSRYGRGRPNLWLPKSNIGIKGDES